MNEQVIMGDMPTRWSDSKNILYLTICVTEDCNLACSYCYCVHKNSFNKLSKNIGNDIIDFIMSEPLFEEKEGIILDFIGGEPTLEMELIEHICDYFVLKMYEINHKWLNCYMFMIGTNGLSYSSDKVQKFIEKYYAHCIFGISIDGIKIKHDMSRKKKNGEGSYDDIIENVKLWNRQFPYQSAKATFCHDDIIYLNDSIIHLWNLGINYVIANIVFEDVWRDDDEKIYEEQLLLLADYVLENKLWNKHSVLFFRKDLGLPVPYIEMDNNLCGAGNSLAIDCKGNIFPCHRFFDFTQDNNEGFLVGNIYDGINIERLRPLMALTYSIQSPEECMKCEVAQGCGWCTGNNCNCDSNKSIYNRATYICKMHKANARVNKYFWKKYSEITKEISPYTINQFTRVGHNTKYLYILKDNIDIPFCMFDLGKTGKKSVMSSKMVEKGIRFAENNNMLPIIIGDDEQILDPHYTISKDKSDNMFSMQVVKADKIDKTKEYSSNIILTISKNDLVNIVEDILYLAIKVQRINMIIYDLKEWDENNLKQYENVIQKILNRLTSNKKIIATINIMHDLMNATSMINCNAGVKSLCLADNGKVYLCPAFYFENDKDYIGDIDNGINNQEVQMLCRLEKSSLCKECNNYSCKRCIYMNRKITGEYTTPSSLQCKIENINRRAAKCLQEFYRVNYPNTKFRNMIYENYYDDLIEKILLQKGLK